MVSTRLILSACVLYCFFSVAHGLVKGLFGDRTGGSESQPIRSFSQNEGCKNPKSPRNGRVSCTISADKSKCTATCKPGYTFPDESDRIEVDCSKSNGVWSPITSFPDCLGSDSQSSSYSNSSSSPNKCEKPAAPINGRYSCQISELLYSCVGTCFSGYSFPGGSKTLKLECSQKTGIWSPSQKLPDCIGSGGSGGSMAYGQIDPGPYSESNSYSQSSSGTTSNGASNQRQSYSASQGEGSEQEQSYQGQQVESEELCVKPKSPMNGRLLCSMSNGKWTCTATCSPGYSFSNGSSQATLTCSEQIGRWSPTYKFQDCIAPNKCEKPAAPLNGRYSCQISGTSYSCVGTCFSGYSFPGGSKTLKLECSQKTGIWSPSQKLPDCIGSGGSAYGQRVDPGSYSESHSYSQNSSGTTSQGTSNQRKSYSGSQGEGSEEVQSYQGNQLEGGQRLCLQPKSPKNGGFSCSMSNGEWTCQATCLNGYTFPDGSSEATLECSEKNGRWSPKGKFENCSAPRKCEKPSPPMNGRYECQITGTLYSCTGSCLAGYAFPGGLSTMKLECTQRNGIWSPSQKFPDCVGSASTRGYGSSGFYPGSYNESYSHSSTGGTSYGGRGETQSQQGFSGSKSNETTPGSYSKSHTSIHSTSGGTSRGGSNEAESYEGSYGRGSGQTQSPQAFDVSQFQRLCKQPKSPMNGALHCSMSNGKWTCQATCSPGYSFPNGSSEATLECSERNGRWSPKQKFENCSAPSKCEKPSPPMNGRYECQITGTLYSCSGSCLAGYAFPDGSSTMKLECTQRNGVWSPSQKFPDCVGSGDSRGYGSRIVSPGSYSESHSYSHSTSGGTSSVRRNETQSQHGSGGSRSYGTYPGSYSESHRSNHSTSGGTSHEGSDQTQLHQGSFGGGLDEMQSHQAFDVSQFQQLCQQPKSPMNGAFHCSMTNGKWTCQATCWPGYSFPDGSSEANLECSEENGRWFPQGKFEDCSSPKKCDKPTPPMNGRYHCQITGIQYLCTGSCLAGYAFPGGSLTMKLKCSQRTGVWSPSQKFPDCVGSSGSSLGYGQTVRNPGSSSQSNSYSHTSSSSSGKTSYGEGSEESQRVPAFDVSQFQRICQQPKSPMNGAIHCSMSNGEWSCQATCRPGYSFPDGSATATTTCSERTGRWSPREKFENCQGSAASTGYGQTVNGQVSGSSSQSSSFSHTSSGSSGKTSYGEGSDESQLFPAFDLSQFQALCQQPKSPMNGALQCSMSNGEWSCQATCNPGYSFPDGSTRGTATCSERNGQWSPQEKFEDCKGSGGGSMGYGRTVTNPGFSSHSFSHTSSGSSGKTSYGEGSDETQRFQGLGAGQACQQPKSPMNGVMHCSKANGKWSCQATCNSGYQFPDKSRQAALKCNESDGLWEPKFADCQLYCYPPCKNGGLCADNNQCKCSSPYRGNRCQYATALCEVQILSNDSSLQADCRHNSELTECNLSCPSGMTLEPQGYSYYMCTVDGMWNPPTHPECKSGKATKPTRKDSSSSIDRGSASSSSGAIGSSTSSQHHTSTSLGHGQSGVRPNINHQIGGQHRIGHDFGEEIEGQRPMNGDIIGDLEGHPKTDDELPTMGDEFGGQQSIGLEFPSFPGKRNHDLNINVMPDTLTDGTTEHVSGHDFGGQKSLDHEFGGQESIGHEFPSFPGGGLRDGHDLKINVARVPLKKDMFVHGSGHDFSGQQPVGHNFNGQESINHEFPLFPVQGLPEDHDVKINVMPEPLKEDTFKHGSGHEFCGQNLVGHDFDDQKSINHEFPSFPGQQLEEEQGLDLTVLSEPLREEASHQNVLSENHRLPISSNRHEHGLEEFNIHLPTEPKVYPQRIKGGTYQIPFDSDEMVAQKLPVLASDEVEAFPVERRHFKRHY